MSFCVNTHADIGSHFMAGFFACIRLREKRCAFLYAAAFEKKLR